jgi:hypothetical protein
MECRKAKAHARTSQRVERWPIVEHERRATISADRGLD